MFYLLVATAEEGTLVGPSAMVYLKGGVRGSSLQENDRYELFLLHRLLEIEVSLSLLV